MLDPALGGLPPPVQYLQVTMHEVSSDWGAVEGPGPGARQTHGVVRVHVGQKEEPCGTGPAQAPEVHSDGRMGDQGPVHGGGVGESPARSSWAQSSRARFPRPRPEGKSRWGSHAARDPNGKPGQQRTRSLAWAKRRKWPCS